MSIIKNNKTYGIKVKLLQPEPSPAESYFYVEDISGSDNTLSIQKSDTSAPTIEVFKSTDQTNWSSMGSTSEETPITATIPANSKLYLKATADRWNIDYNGNSINTSGMCNIGGNIMSLLYGDKFQGQLTFPTDSSFNFSNLFNGCSTLISATNLSLPAMILANFCYAGMFQNCTSLTTAPSAITAASIGDVSMSSMFQNCTSLTTAPQITINIINGSWVCSHIFEGCTSLQTAPLLKFNALSEGALDWAFQGCSNFSSVTIDTPNYQENAFVDWLNGVSSTGNFINLGGASFPTDSASGIPTGWTEHTSL